MSCSRDGEDEKILINRPALHEAICRAYRTGATDFIISLNNFVTVASENLINKDFACNYTDGYIDACLKKADELQTERDASKKPKLGIVPDEQKDF